MSLTIVLKFADCTHDNQNLLIEDIVMVKGEPAHDGSGNAIPESKLSVKSRTNVRRKKVGRPRKITNHGLYILTLYNCPNFIVKNLM